jgi:hypothetical protein
MLDRVYIRNPVPLRRYLREELSPAASRLFALLHRHELHALGNPGRLRLARIGLVWALVMAVSCTRYFFRYRAHLRRELPRVRDLTHLRRLFACAFLDNIPPFEFYRFGFYLDRFHRHRRAYLLRWHLDPLLVRSIPEDSRWMSDKHRFWHAASAAGLPVVPVWAALSAGAWTEGDFETLSSRAADLVVKPSRLGRGDGILFADALAPDRWDVDGQSVSTHQLRDRLEAYSREHDLVIQPRVRNHPAFARYSSEGLATLRIVTFKTPETAEPVCLVAALRIPHGAARLANLHKSALVCSIDIATGRLSPASGADPSREDLLSHPITGAPLAGEIVPHWEECLRICRAGHLLAPALNSIGWDVIIDESGPKLLEANLRWGAHVLQISGGTPLLLTRLPELYREASPA